MQGSHLNWWYALSAPHQYGLVHCSLSEISSYFKQDEEYTFLAILCFPELRIFEHFRVSGASLTLKSKKYILRTWINIITFLVFLVCYKLFLRSSWKNRNMISMWLNEKIEFHIRTSTRYCCNLIKPRNNFCYIILSLVSFRHLSVLQFFVSYPSCYASNLINYQ